MIEVGDIIGGVIWTACVFMLGWVFGQRKQRRILFGPNSDRRYWL